jgi:PleD family two-component response regulator
MKWLDLSSDNQRTARPTNGLAICRAAQRGNPLTTLYPIPRHVVCTQYKGQHMARVLVVDDVADDVAAWAAVLGNEGHVVLTAFDGISAAQACDQFLPDLVVTDLELPGLNGLGLIA